MTLSSCLLHGRHGAEFILLELFFNFCSQASFLLQTLVGHSDSYFKMLLASVIAAKDAGRRMIVPVKSTITSCHSCRKRSWLTGKQAPLEGGSSMRETPLLATRGIVLVVQIRPRLAAAGGAEIAVASRACNVGHVIHSWVVGGCCEGPALCSSPIIGSVTPHNQLEQCTPDVVTRDQAAITVEDAQVDDHLESPDQDEQEFDTRPP